ncbi:hypothetical protein ACSU6B_23385 [Neobacillus sp. C211]|uniref:hypothetical protein n=1 Tax=unclassified Neobacillus TaxID=2675272 RepID=UPI00397D06FA
MAEHYYGDLNLNYVAIALKDVMKERIRQYEKFGLQADLSWGEHIAILGEEFGEACQALMGVMQLDSVKETDQDDPEMELIHVAAVAVKMVELLRLKKEGRL